MEPNYVVLKKNGDNGEWRVEGEVYANNADQAVRVVADPAGEYIAIAGRKWHYRPAAIAEAGEGAA